MVTKTKRNLESLWKAIIGEIEIKSPMFKSLGTKAHLRAVSENEIDIACEDEFTRNNIESKYLKQISKTIHKILEEEINVKTIISKKDSTEISKKDGKESEMGPLFSSQKSQDELIIEKQIKSNLNSKFTFESFVTGTNNNLAYAISSAVAERPGEQYNPVFIYSGVGLGKTHLIQAIGNRIIETKPGMKVIYTTGEQFTNELIESIQSGRKGKYASNEFRNKFRKADVFLIDDIQFIIGREATQEEFFHTFNTLSMTRKQIVITSDRPPRDFINIEERITSRFASGVIADIQPPNLEIRIAILRNLRDKNRDAISNDVIDYIAERVATNVRELEGAYMQVLTQAKSLGLSPKINNIEQFLGHSVRERPKSNVNMNDVLKHVCTYYSVKTTEIKGRRRTKDIVLPRQVAMYLIKEITDTPYMTIGEFLGGRDHSTIMHGVEKIEDNITKVGKLRQDVVNIKQMLYRG